MFDGSADLVVANIIANVIIEMAEDLRARTRHGGKVIASGIIEKRYEEVQAALEDAGLQTVEIRRDEDWITIVSERAE